MVVPSPVILMGSVEDVLKVLGTVGYLSIAGIDSTEQWHTAIEVRVLRIALRRGSIGV